MIKSNGSLTNLPPATFRNHLQTNDYLLNNSFSCSSASSSSNREQLDENFSIAKNINLFKINHMNRSNSVDLTVTNRKLNKSVHNSSNTTITSTTTTNNTHDSNVKMNNCKLNTSNHNVSSLNNSSTSNRSKSSIPDQSTTLIEFHKFLKDKQIYTNPDDNFKRRTVVLIRSASSKRPSTPVNSSKLRHNASTSQADYALNNTNNGEFGFHLQAYGVINISTQQTEYICFVNNVQPNSPAQQAGLNNGDVILAIDGVCINEFTSLDNIMNHVRGKSELRLVIMSENICKKIQLKQRYGRLKKMIEDKKQELDRISREEENILKKYNINLINSSSSSSNTTNSSILSAGSSSIECFVSPNQKSDQSSNGLIKNSTPNEQMTSSTTSSTSSSSIALTPSDSMRKKKLPPVVAAIISRADSRVNKSKSSPNGTARITVENNFPSPLNLPSTSSSTSSFTSEVDSSPSSSSASTSSSSDQASKQVSFTSVTRPDLEFLKQTPRMSRSELSSSTSILTKLNFKATPRHASQLNNPSLTRLTQKESLRTSNENTNLLKAKSNSLENSLNDQSDLTSSSRNSDVTDSKVVNFVALSDSFTPASLSSSITSSSLSSSSSISPHLQLTSSLIDKSFNNEIDTGVGVGIGTVTTDSSKLDSSDKLDNSISKYSNDSYVITRL